MIGLLGVVGGAAALEIRRLRGKNNTDKDGQVQELKKTVEQYAKDLEQERRSAAAASRKASGLEAEADALRRNAESLGREREELSQQNAQLLLDKLRLQDETSELAQANRMLTDKVSQLSAEQEAEAARFAAELAALRDRVAAVLQRMFSSEIDETAAVEALRELGCEVCYVPGDMPMAPSTGEASYTFTPRLLLDDPAKMARLMQAAISQGGGGSSSPRLLDAPSTAGAGNLTPRIARDGAGQRTMQAALTIAGTSGGSGGSTPRFTLSWLGSGADAPAAPGAPAQALQRISDGQAGAVPSDASAAGADATPKPAKAATSTAASSGPKVVAKSSGRVEQSGNLVFSSNSKQGKGNKSRLGLSLTDAAGIFGGKKGAGTNAPASGFEPLIGAAHEEAHSDVGGTKDLVTRK